MKRALAVILLLSAEAAFAEAFVPELINYQGMMYLENGSNEVTGTFDLQFRLYDAIAGGNLLWGEQLNAVRVFKGRFNVVLGNGTAIDGTPHDALSEVFRQSQVYMEVAAAGGKISAVRQRFVSAPHALRTQNAANAIDGVPVGTVMPYMGGTAPAGWLLCNGAAYDKADPQYQALYAALCSSGVCVWGEDAAQFNVPNLGGRTLAGANATYGLGTRRGEEKHQLTTAEIPQHNHSYQDKYWNGDEEAVDAVDQVHVRDNSLSAKDDLSGFTGSSVPHNEIQPSAVVNYIIKY